MGEVWSVRNERTNRELAIKFLLPALTRNPEALHRFVREAKATGQLHHPNIVTALDAGMHESRPYFVMELLSGESLEQRLARDRRLDDLEVCILMAQVARAVDHAHRAGLVHRDLSAANVFLCVGQDESPPTVKVLDFGVSKVLGVGVKGRVRTGNGAVLGSPAYMSPEQARGAENVDAGSDVWSLGVLAYQCASGRLPFEAANYNALIHAISSAPHDPLASTAPEVDEELVDLIEGCLVKDRELRIPAARELIQRLEAIALRLSRNRSRALYVPLRRSIDRMRSSESGGSLRWLSRRALPVRVLPWGVRVARRLATSPRPLVLSAGIAAGLAAGWGVPMLTDAHSLSGYSQSPSAALACPPPKPAQRAKPATLPLQQPAVSAAAVAAAQETDLVRAMARGLSVDESGASDRPRRHSN